MPSPIRDVYEKDDESVLQAKASVSPTYDEGLRIHFPLQL